MEFKVELEYNGHHLGVEGTMNPFVPAIKPSFNDPGSPAEGGDYEVTDIYVLRFSKNTGERARKLCRYVLDGVADEDRFQDALAEKLYPELG
jgi:hypothetical protein